MKEHIMRTATLLAALLLTCTDTALAECGRRCEVPVPVAAGSSTRPAAAAANANAAPVAAAGGVDYEAAALSAMAAGQPARFIVTYKVTSSAAGAQAATAGAPAAAAGGGPAAAGPAAAEHAVRLGAQDAVKASVASAARGVAVAREFDQLPVNAVNVASAAALEALRGDPLVESVEPDRMNFPALLESLPLINQAAVAASGKQGTGCYVAVVDSGANYTHPDLGSCTSPGAPASCRVAYARDFAANDNNLDDMGHGTNVAATISRLAPGAQILALDVFTFDGTNHYAWDSDILAAINWAVGAKTAGTYNVCAINLSLGSSSVSPTPCTGSSFESAFSSARAAGIAPVVAAGNGGSKTGIASPGCAPSAISVGAVYDSNTGGWTWGGGICTDYTSQADQVACFSQSATYLTMLAPGVFITAGGYNMGGTSQATPHVAGAAAVLKAAYPSATVAQIVAAMRAGGKPVLDSSSGYTHTRLDLSAAVAVMNSGDFSPPTGSVQINGGAANSLSLDVTLSIAGSDASGVSQMCVSNTAASLAACAPFQAFAASKAWRLAEGGDGARIVYVYLKDGQGNAMATAITAATTYTTDVTPPTASVLINGGAANTSSLGVTLAISGSDAGGVASMCLSNAAVTAAACSPFEAFAASKAWTLAAGADGVRTVYLFLRDNAGNTMSTAATASINYIAPDTAAPTISTFQINGGAVSTSFINVTLAIAASDPSGVATMCLSNTAVTAAACSPFEAYAASKAWTLAAGADGARTVYLFLRDTAGNTMSTAATASITYSAPDTAPPTVSAFQINGGAASTTSLSVTLAITASDASGVATMCLSNTAVSAAACLPYEAYAGSKAWTLAAGADGTRTVYLYLRDTLGNTMASAAQASIVISTTPSDSTPPTVSSFQINGGAASTTSLAVTLTIAGSDASGVATMCLSNTAVSAAACPLYEAFASTKPWTLASGAGGSRTVRLFLRDAAGNTMATAAMASITYVAPVIDTTPPTVSSFLINGGDAITTSLDVALAIAGSDASGVQSMCISNAIVSAGACAPYEAYTPIKAWTLAAGAGGARTVLLYLRDAAGNTMSTAATAVITYSTPSATDVDPPTGTLTINGGALSTNTLDVTLSIAGSDGAGGSGVPWMCISNTAGCTTGFEAFAPTQAWTLAEGDGKKTVYIWLKDAAGNAMAAPATASILLATSTSTLTINGGAAYTASRSVTLGISTQGATPKTRMCITQTANSAASCSSWSGYNAAKKITLSQFPQGERTIRVFFKGATAQSDADALQPAVAMITYDTVAPSMSAADVRLKATTARDSISVSYYAAATDATSTVASFVLVGRQGASAPSKCSGSSLKKATSDRLASTYAVAARGAAGGSGAAGAAELVEAAFTGLRASASYGFRLCAIDSAGNVAAGITVVTRTLA